MLKDILVHIPVEGAATPVIDCAVSLAVSFKANLTAVAFDYQVVNAAIALDGSVAVAAIEREWQAVAALDQVAIAAKNAGISHSARKIDVFGPAGEILARVSRLHDLTIIRQPEAAKPGLDDKLAEAVLMSSGRPILLVPYNFAGPVKIKRVLICWDGGQVAARTTHDAMPFLHAAESLKIVSLNEKDPDALETSSKALAEHQRNYYLNPIATLSSDVCTGIVNAL